MSNKVFVNNSPYSEDPAFIKIASTKVLGFWIYLMSDCVLFATLFTTYEILSSNVFTNHTGGNIFDLHYILIETFCLLTSTFTFGLSIHAMNHENKILVLTWLAIT